MSSSRPIGLTPKQFGATNAVVTLAAMSFLVWVIYFHEGSGSASRAASLPLINAILNGTSAVLISVGLWAIKQRKRTLHMQLMIAAFASSALFLANYIYLPIRSAQLSVGDREAAWPRWPVGSDSRRACFRSSVG
jgi:uncharacterized membrane protein YozB (DUF420 family)